MVNHGVSRGCETCKRRRKKCDETRPACSRCSKAKRTCLGYKDDVGFVFRQYDGGDQTKPPLPVSANVARGDFRNPSGPVLGFHRTLKDEQIEREALEIFLQDYSLTSKDRSISCGYLDGLSSLLYYAGPSSEVLQACKVVSLANLGNKSRSLALLTRAKTLYFRLLRSFQTTLSNPQTSNTLESLITAVLLGLYEIISATETHPGEHGAHVKGVSAILSAGYPILESINRKHTFQVASPTLIQSHAERPQKLGILCAPTPNHPVMTLELIMRKMRARVGKADDLIASTSTDLTDLYQIRQGAQELGVELDTWQETQPAQFSPRTIGFIDVQQAEGKFAIFLPGPVDVYFDVYVSAVWLTYYKCRLLLLDLIFKCSKRLHEDENQLLKERTHAEIFARKIISCIPFHLVQDPGSVLQEHNSGYNALSVGRPLGGLLIMHPLHIGSKSSVVPESLQDHMRKCLAWIGENMGIGQARLLSKVPLAIPREFVMDGHMLIWAGMLIKPADDVETI